MSDGGGATKREPAAEETRGGWPSRRVAWALVGAGFVSAGVLIAWWYFHVRDWAGHHYAEAGAFGDAFAPAVGLLSSLALGAAVASVFLQRSELRLQRSELRATREELTLQRQQMKETGKTFAKQAKLQENANELQLQANTLTQNEATSAKYARKAEQEALARQAELQEKGTAAQTRANELAAAASRIEALRLEVQMFNTAPGSKSRWSTRYGRVKALIDERTEAHKGYTDRELIKIFGGADGADEAEYAKRFYYIEKNLNVVREMLFDDPGRPQSTPDGIDEADE